LPTCPTIRLTASCPRAGRARGPTILPCAGLSGRLVCEAGIAFHRQTPRDLLAGPVSMPDILCTDDLDGELEHVLESVGIEARAVEADNGAWLVKAGSEVRVDPVSSAGSVVMSLRHEVDFSGVLKRKAATII
jgi:hypothetical protein